MIRDRRHGSAGSRTAVLSRRRGGDKAMGKRLTQAERDARALTEREFQKGYVAALRSLGFLVAHHYDSRFSDEGTKGLPDLQIVGHGVFWMDELKREHGKLSDAQRGWISQAARAGVVVNVWRPSDWEAMMGYIEAMAMEIVASPLRAMPKHKVKKRRAKPSTE